VIEDDDALDGWLVKQKRENDRRKNEKTADDVLGQHSNADEVYIMTDGREEAEAIYDMNDPDARFAVVEREAHLAREGELNYTEFSDVKRRVNEQINEMMKARRG
jgi:hypothetical protein